MDQQNIYAQPLDHDFVVQQRRPSLFMPTQQPSYTKQGYLMGLPALDPPACTTPGDDFGVPSQTLTLEELVASNKCPNITVTGPSETEDVQQVPRSPSYGAVARRFSDASSTLADEDQRLSTISVNDLQPSPAASPWLYQDDGASPCGPSTPAASPCTLPPTPGTTATTDGDLPFPEHVLHMNGRELKKWLRAQNLTESEKADIKKQRRRWMNRVYAKRARDKKSLEEVNGGAMCAAQMQAKITRLQSEVDGLRAVQAQLVSIMNSRCPDALAMVPLGS